MYFMVSHSAQGASERNLHFHEEFEFPPNFVQQVGNPIGILGNLKFAVTKVVNAGSKDSCPFVPIQKRPDRNAGIYNVFTMVACIVPTASYV